MACAAAHAIFLSLFYFRPVSAPLFPGQQHQRCAAQQQGCAPRNHIALIAGLDAGIFGLSGLVRLFGLIVRVLRAAGGALAVLIVVALGGDHLTPGQQSAALTAVTRSSAPLVEALAQLLSR